MPTLLRHKHLHETWAIARETISDWDDDHAMSLAAALAFYSLLSLAPLLVIAVSGAALFFGDEAARGEISSQLTSIVGREPANAVEAVVMSARASHAGVVGTALGGVVLLIGASGMFIELQSALNAVWKVPPRPGQRVRSFMRDRFFSFAMVLATAVVLFASLLLSTALSAIGTFFTDTLPGGATLWQVASTISSFVLTGALFTSLFVVVPDAKVALRDATTGALVAAVLFTIGKWVLGLYLGKASFGSAYGAAGSFVALVVWIYYSAQILLLGAEVAHVMARRRGALRATAAAPSLLRCEVGEVRSAEGAPPWARETARCLALGDER